MPPPPARGGASALRGSPRGTTPTTTWWTVQFFLNVVDFGMDLQEAIDAPNFHTQHFPSSFYPHGAHPKRVVVEGRISEDARRALEDLGHEIVVTGDWANGQVCAVRFNP